MLGKSIYCSLKLKMWVNDSIYWSVTCYCKHQISFFFSIFSFLFIILIPIYQMRSLLRSQSLSAAEPGPESRSNVEAWASSSAVLPRRGQLRAPRVCPEHSLRQGHLLLDNCPKATCSALSLHNQRHGFFPSRRPQEEKRGNMGPRPTRKHKTFSTVWTNHILSLSEVQGNRKPPSELPLNLPAAGDLAAGFVLRDRFLLRRP